MTSHRKSFGQRMKALARRYKAGEFGNMSWKDIVRKYMRSGSTPKSAHAAKRRRSRSRRHRRSRR